MLLSKGETTPPCGVPARSGSVGPLTGLPALSMRLDQAQHPPVRHSLGHERQEFLMVNRPKEILQVGVHDPLRCPLSISFQILRRASLVDRPRRYPKLASSNTGSKIGSSRFSSACWHTRS